MTQGIVAYTDGGCRGGTNPGFGGYGIHGYLYEDAQPKKSPQCPTCILTAKGYVVKDEVTSKYGYGEKAASHPGEVTPKHYIDGFGSFTQPISNNVAELYGAIAAMRHALEYDISELYILVDSDYVRNGYNQWAEEWRRNNWTKRDGSIPANISVWKDLLELRDRLRQRGAKVVIARVAAHTGDLGNEAADKLATIGCMASMARNALNLLEATPSENYWKFEPDRHPFIANRRMYFNTVQEENIRGEYFLGDGGKDDDDFGTRISDGAYSVVIIKKPDDVLENIRNHLVQLANGTDKVMSVRLDQVFRSDVYRQLERYGKHATIPIKGNRFDLACVLDEEPLVKEFRPPKLAMRGVEAIESLASKLKLFVEKHPSIILTDLTPILYNIEEKTSKKNVVTIEHSLKPEYNVGFASLPVTANYKSGDEVHQASVTLTLGYDLLDRNALKRLEDIKPKVTLITWLESEKVFRYATVIESETPDGIDYGIWCSIYANLRVISEEESK